MPIANGLEKKVRYKRQVSFGAPITGAVGGQAVRRVTSTVDLSKDTYRSNEIRDDKQRNDFRHGSRTIGGSISGELSVGTYADFLETFCRQAYQVGAATGAAITTVAITVAGNVATYTRTGGSFITDGFKLGDVGRWTGWATVAAPQNANNFMVTSLSALAMSGIFLNGTVPVAKAAGDPVQFTLQGKKTWVPLTGHTNDCYTIEHWYSDIGQSEVFDSCRLGTMKLSLPPTGMATAEFGFVGRDMLRGVASYFTAPAAPTTGGALAAVNGILFVKGVQVAILTGLSIDGNANASTSQVVGSNTTPDVFMGAVDVSGQITAHFQDATLRDLFVDETEADIMMAFTADNTATAGFIAFVLPRIKAGGASKDDGEKGLTLTMPFTALLGAAVGGTSLATTISVQDSSK
jgi:hypothetical protein